MTEDERRELERQDWAVVNRERGLLIDKNIAGTLNAEEQARLDLLEAYADYHLADSSRWRR